MSPLVTTDFTEETLIAEDEQEESDSRRGDGSKPHKGQLYSDELMALSPAIPSGSSSIKM